MLSWYQDAVLESNSGSIFVLENDESTSWFKRLFLAFGGCVEGFKFCVLVLFVDRTFGKSIYKGQILTAIAKDGDQGKCFIDVNNFNFFLIIWVKKFLFIDISSVYSTLLVTHIVKESFLLMSIMYFLIDYLLILYKQYGFYWCH